MRTRNKFILTGCTLSLCLAMVGCGSSDGATTTDEPTSLTKTTFSVSGTVPGTLIEALCKDGRYYSVNSTDDGSSNHPFTMTLPSDVSCKFIMTTNEKDPDPTKHIITPIVLNNGTTTSTYFQLTKDVDIGHVALALTGTGIQEPITLNISNQEMEVNKFSYDPLDKDNDGVPNIYEDDDEDGLYNKDDDDDDGDGIKDEDDEDYKNDSDGDGVEDSADQDDDNDEIRDSDDDSDDENTNTATIVLPTSYTADAGRLLGSQCAQCHGTNGISVNEWDSIAGEDELEDEIFEDDEPIMNAQAHGYTSDEITLIGNWLKTLKK